MKTILIGAVALAMTAAALPAAAQGSRSENREVRQDYRIYRGVTRGEITPREARRLERQQNRVDRTQRRAARDGVITWEEQRRIERQQDRASRNIHRKSHNNRIMYW